jgi:protoporphyrinogen oxidase
MNVAIVGAGIAGLTAAYDLTGQGHRTTVYEASPTVGGLASGFRDETWDWWLERFYHHWFTSDRDVIGLIHELGLADRLLFPRPITAIWHEGGMYALDSPLALLRFPHLNMADKLRTGMVLAFLRYTRFWRQLERHTAHEWLPRFMGRRAYETLWQPLLIGKFSEKHYRDVSMAWFWARIYKRSPRLGYFVGGFQAFADALADRIRERGGNIRLSTAVRRIVRTQEGRLRLEATDGDETFDAVIATVSPSLMTHLAPELPADYLGQLRDLQSMGAVVLVLALRRQLISDVYWLNLPAERFPFLALVEHTNYISPQYYGGDHLVYLGHYLPPEHPYFQMTEDQLLETFLKALPHFNPHFDRSWVRAHWLFRETYAQPVVPVNYSRMIPPLATPIPGLYLASMSQVYPWDRGTNYAVEMGRRVARRVGGGAGV